MTGDSAGSRPHGAPPEYIPFVEARAAQAALLEQAVGSLAEQISAWQVAGTLTGEGPVFVGIGASLAAACAPVWSLRERGLAAWRLGSGDAPLPFPSSEQPVIGISQSGRSSETLAALGSIDDALRYAVVNTDPSPIADLVGDRAMRLGNLPDSYASTVGYTATIAALGMMADAWAGGTVDPGWASLPAEFGAVDAALAEPIARALELFEGAAWADYVGAGPATGSAEAGALLLREVARVPATAMSTRQYLHGAMESAGGGVHVVFGDRRELSLTQTLVGAGHRVLLVTSEDVAESPGLVVLRMPKRPAAQRAVLEAAALQALAAGVAARRGVEIEEFVFQHDDTKVATGTGTGS